MSGNIFPIVNLVPEDGMIRVMDCDELRHSAAILNIFNHAILYSTALYDYQARTSADMQAWFAGKRANNFPVLGIEDEAGELLAFASYGAFRERPAYKYTVEHSVYVREDQRGQRLGERLLQALIERAVQQDYHVLMGVIDATNQASIALHVRCGFRQVGMLPQTGFKFGKWLDAALYQLILSSPAQPVDG